MSGTFPTHDWDQSSRSGWISADSLERNEFGVISQVGVQDRPRRTFAGVLKHIDAAEASAIDTLYRSNVIAGNKHDEFAFTDPWTGDSFNCIFIAPPETVLEKFGYRTVTVQLEESAASTRSLGASGGDYPDTGQWRGTRKLAVDPVSVRRTSYGAAVAHNHTDSSAYQFQVVHDLLSASELASHIDHYEANFRGDFSFTFDVDGTTHTCRYSQPPQLGQNGARFRFTALLEKV